MLTEAQRSELRDHLSATLRQMDAATKTNIYSYEPTPFFSQVLLDHAVRFVAGQRGSRAPKLAEPTAGKIPVVSSRKGGVLRSFAQSPFGPWLLILVALG
jgi:hypothetical protein